MAQNFLSCDRDQVLLLPPDLGEWLPAGHLARFVVESVDQLDLQSIYAYYRQDGHGRPAHDPAMMVGLVLYAHAVGVTSSRAIERRCVDDVAFRYITANRQPDHATVARFLIRHRGALQGLFVQVLALCQRAGLLRAGTVAIDSTKLGANASATQNYTLAGLEELAARVIEEAIRIDEREDQLYGERRGDELPDDLADPRTRPARIRELLEELRRERAQADAEREAMIAAREEHLERTGRRKPGRPPKQDGQTTRQRKRAARKVNVTDPDSAVVRHRGMLMQGYSVQTAVAEGQIVLAARATDAAPDSAQLSPSLAAAQENLARIDAPQQIERVLADTGYWNGPAVARIRDAGLRVLIPPYDKAKTGRYVHPEVPRMRAELEDPEARTLYRQRQQIIEPVFAHIKHHRGITRVLRRGRAAVQAEIDLIFTSHNLLKLYRAAPTPA